MSETDINEVNSTLDLLVVASTDEALTDSGVNDQDDRDQLSMAEEQQGHRVVEVDKSDTLPADCIPTSSSGDINELEEHPHYEHTILVPVQDAASMSTDQIDNDTAVKNSEHVDVEVIEELQSPEVQRRAAILLTGEGAIQAHSSRNATVTIAAEDVLPENSNVAQQTRKKKPTSTERRALRDAKLAAAGKTPSTGENTPALTEVPNAETPGVLNADASASSKKLSGKQRKARAKRLALEKEAEAQKEVESAIQVAEAQPTEKISPPQETQVQSKKKTKLGSRERKALKLARQANQAMTSDDSAQISSAPAATETVAPAVLPVVVESQAAVDAAETEGIPKARKLNSKQRKAKRRALEAEAAAVTLAALGTAPVPDSVPSLPLAVARNEDSDNQKAKRLSKKQKQAAEVPLTTSASNVTANATGKHAPAKPAPSKSDVEGKHAIADASPQLSLAPNAIIALHATLAVLRQGLLSRDSVIYTQQGAMKMHLLTELCKLGYECVEGNAASFQNISWSASNQCLTYTGAIVNVPLQYPAALRPKGDLKITSPALSMQLRCFPTFGAGSPALMGKKNFRNRFIRSVKEVVQGETDSFIFALPLQVYSEFALDAMGSLPAVYDIKRHFTEYNVAYSLRALSCSVETAYGEFVIGSLIVA